MSQKPRRSAKAPAPAAPIYRLRVTLAEIEPPVWRCIRVRGDLSLESLHDVFQCAMGWQVDDEAKPTLRDAAPVEGARFAYL